MVAAFPSLAYFPCDDLHYSHFQQTEEPCSALEQNNNSVCRVRLCTPVTPAQRQSTASSKPATITHCVHVHVCG